MTPARLLQQRYFDAFRCIGSDCEDTCCVGWIVHVDKPTYEKYQNCSDPALGPSLRTFIKINDKSLDDDDYAMIALDARGCPFLSERLCSIQLRLGEGYLSNMCATYPRVMNRVGEVLHRSLDLSCPEAARAVLLNPGPIEFEEEDYQEGSIRLANDPSLDTSSLNDYPEPYRLYRDIRRHVISLLQDRSHPIWQRLFAVGCLCEKLDELRLAGWERNSPDVIQEYMDIAGGVLSDLAANCSTHPAVQLETVLELIVARITSDANPPRFLECYKEFMSGVGWTSKSTMEEIGARYSEAYSEHYVPYMRRQEHMLEHYLVNYTHRTLFPFGLPQSNTRLHNHRVPSPYIAQYMAMTAYFAITQTLLIGMAAFHKTAFNQDHIVKLIQSSTKTFEHSLTYPARAIEMLAKKGLTSPTALSVLIRT
jgi:lysine-N-methylase